MNKQKGSQYLNNLKNHTAFLFGFRYSIFVLTFMITFAGQVVLIIQEIWKQDKEDS